MAFNVTGLTNYTNEQSTELVIKSLFGSKTAAVLQAAGQVQVGVKSAEALNILSSDVFFQADGCGYTPLLVTLLFLSVLSPLERLR
jgi:predicted naringenin-chalcone synthase